MDSLQIAKRETGDTLLFSLLASDGRASGGFLFLPQWNRLID